MFPFTYNMHSALEGGTYFPSLTEPTSSFSLSPSLTSSEPAITYTSKSVEFSIGRAAILEIWSLNVASDKDVSVNEKSAP